MAPFLLNAINALVALQATVGGGVRNGETGEPVAGVVVALIDLSRATTTDNAGRYVLRDVPSGPQQISVRFIGYAQRTLHALVPPAGQLEINISLDPYPRRLQTIEVHPRMMVRGIDDDGTALPDRGSSMAAVRNYPLLAEPDALQALAGGEVVIQPESPSGVHVRGGASDQTAYLLDGVPVFSPYHAAGVFAAWNPDALAGVRVSSAAPSPAYPNALSGVIVGVTRTPDAQVHTLGSVSTAQARVTIDGPLGETGAGYLVSMRSGFPGFAAREHDASYLQGEIGDWLVKLEAPAFGGQTRLLAYDNENVINAAAFAKAARTLNQDFHRNSFAWHSRSLGAEWRRIFSSNVVRLLGWSAVLDAGSAWAAKDGWADLAAARRDLGLLATLEHGSARGATVAGVRVEQSQTSYRVTTDTAADPSLALRAQTPVAAVFAQHARAISRRTALELATSVTAARGELHLEPRAQLRWKLSNELTLSGSYARLHQFEQSLRNTESVVGNVFPVDLYIGSGAAGVPVARSDQGVIAAAYRPSAGVRIGLQAYDRDFDGLLLAARDGEPFATNRFEVGDGAAQGVSVDAAVSTTHYGIVASYGIQHVELEDGQATYVPDYGATHVFEGGVIVFPSTTSSIRLGATGALGRRTTTASGALDWEACTLRDRGCEFGGSPHYHGELLGATPLPAYLRVDLGARKHWHFMVGRRDASVALFGTVTNLFGRQNILAYVKDPSTSARTTIQMRPLAPLVVGVDWQF